MGVNFDRQVWIFADELTTLHKVPDLVSPIPVTRKFGGCFVLGIQPYALVQNIDGVEVATSFTSVLNTRFFCRWRNRRERI